MTEEPLWKTEEVAKYLSISRRMVQRLASEGVLPARRIGVKLLRFSPDEIRRWKQGRDQ